MNRLRIQPLSVHVVSFSPTGGTARIAMAVAQLLHTAAGTGELDVIDLTPPAARTREYHFGAGDLVVVASPVYAGRLPNKIAPDYAACLYGDGDAAVGDGNMQSGGAGDTAQQVQTVAGAIAVPICVFGNRSPGDAVRELTFLLEQNGFLTAGAAAMVCRHAFTDEVGTGRPDAEDAQCQQAFVRGILARLQMDPVEPLPMDRETSIAPYYTPLRTDGQPAKFLKAKPVRTAFCSGCGECVSLCPVGSIDATTLEVTGVCIKCQACVRGCPMHAMILTDENFLSHVDMLRRDYTGRAENQIYV